MKKYFAITAVAAAAALMTGAAFAQSAPAADPAPAAAPDTGPLTANVTLASEYRYRGISQSNSKPAIQGGFDYAHESGFYIGNWNSNISWLSDGYSQSPAVSAPIEMDLYAGYKKEVSPGLTLDGGFLQYYYPTSNLPAYSSTGCAGNGRQACGVNPSTTEAYAAATYQFVTLKYSYALTNLFGIDNSRGSGYVDLSANYDTGYEGITINAHVGKQFVSNDVAGYEFTYTDWKLGLTKDFGKVLSGAVAYIGTNANNAVYFAPGSLNNTGRGTALVSLTKTF